MPDNSCLTEFSITKLSVRVKRGRWCIFSKTTVEVLVLSVKMHLTSPAVGHSFITSLEIDFSVSNLSSVSIGTVSKTVDMRERSIKNQLHSQEETWL